MCTKEYILTVIYTCLVSESRANEEAHRKRVQKIEWGLVLTQSQ